VAAQPQLVRAWAMDIAGCFDPEYVWHAIAQTWQTPGAGEALLEQRKSIPAAELVRGYTTRGMSERAAASCAAARNDTMSRCILALYRSAAQPRMAEWGAEVLGVRTRPGLVIIPTGDVYTGGETLARRTAERAGAEVAVLSGLGHWWMCEDPRRGAE